MRQENMTKTQAHFSGIDENPLGFFVGCRNACILALPIWTIVFWVGSKL
ncbi:MULTISPECIES: hypothetical protein [Bacillus cereus group]|nr:MULTISPECIES: hypothetical protein [Bacillus cereus group]QUG99039.1 hypothetical protein HCM98_30505 [Bacillus tropicus]